jgi:hypothetical protein
MHIEVDDLSRPEIHALLNEHLQSMYELSSSESVHALDISSRRAGCRRETRAARSPAYGSKISGTRNAS